MNAEELTTAQVARRLGVKPETVYAYVSRGLLHSRRNADGRGSLFDAAEVDALAAGGRRGVDAKVALAIQTEITLIDSGRLYYRGHDALKLARSERYETVASLLWTGELAPAEFVAPAGMLALAEAVTAPLPASARRTDRLRLIVAASAAADPLRFDTSPAAVVATGRNLIGTMVEALPLRASHQRRPSGSLADRLWPRLTAAEPTHAGLRALNSALILLADHDLAASTVAARVAASTRAHPYAVVSAGLAALDGPLHGAASGIAYQMLVDATRTGDALLAISDRLRVGDFIPGFGHRLYPDGDPRAVMLMALLPEVDGDARADTQATIDALATAFMRHAGFPPNIDFAIAALALLTGMGPEAGETIFAVARTAGWIAHGLEEYRDRSGRFRPSGRYAGRYPSAARTD
jgi:citrate synthase